MHRGNQSERTYGGIWRTFPRRELILIFAKVPIAEKTCPLTSGVLVDEDVSHTDVAMQNTCFLPCLLVRYRVR